MNRLSSNWTIFLKLFIPTFWAIFFGAFCVVILFSSSGDHPIFSSMWSKIVLLLSYLLFFLFLGFTVMRLVRVDFDDTHIYVTNYFKTYRYPYQSIESYASEYYYLFTLVRIRFKSKSKFGKNIFCIAYKPGLQTLNKIQQLDP